MTIDLSDNKTCQTAQRNLRIEKFGRLRGTCTSDTYMYNLQFTIYNATDAAIDMEVFARGEDSPLPYANTRKGPVLQ